ncbi:MAG: SAM-dependent chlorinase/fluorinase [Alphaproteobacteria bacterium]|nr:SAM-dependent chlorinase/fluorinase [Alphaproteobacteria bacterium]
MTFYIDFIADYGATTGIDDLAFSEVNRKLAEEFSKQSLDFPMMKNLSVRPFNTVETGFAVAQLAYNSTLGKQHIVYHNTAPRKDKLDARLNNAGEFLAVTELPNGVRIIGVFGGYTFAFINAPIYRVKCADAGSQFRSRDVFPPCVASLAKHANEPLSTWELLGDQITDVPAVPKNTICSIDGYGNLKTTIAMDANIRSIVIKNITFPVVQGQGIFAVPDGQLILAPGSSGWNGKRFTEVCLRGGSAAKLFEQPVPGDVITLLG